MCNTTTYCCHFRSTRITSFFCFFFFLMIRRPPRSTLFPYNDALPISTRDTAGVTVLDVEQSADHNRCVITLVGEGPALQDAVSAMMRVATELIDLTTHKGEHPRMGATDVVPFVPLGDSTTEQAVDLAVGLATRVWEELHIPVYLYGLAARRPERQDLAKV